MTCSSLSGLKSALPFPFGKCYHRLMLLRYLANLSGGRLTLWCYFIWYVVVLVRYFDASARLWLTSLGLSFIIGTALVINTTRTGASRVKLERWQIIRLYLMPFCVSSFSALVKGRGFVLIFSPNPLDIAIAVGVCVLLCGAVFLAKRLSRQSIPEKQPASVGADVGRL